MTSINPLPPPTPLASTSSSSTSLPSISPQSPLPPPTATQRTFRFVNNTGQTIWVGAQGSVLPENGGWKLDSGQTHDITIPNGWTSGRFWGRTECTFGSGSGTCATGDCGGHLQCNGAGGAPPASLAEFTLNGGGGNDFYDVSYVDGYNVPMIITTSNTQSNSQDPHRCGEAGCPTDVNATCPSALQKKDASGKVVACMSSCAAFNTDQYCCRGAYGTPQTCDTSKWPVNSAQIFKKACPSAYSYAFDDATSTFTCQNCSYQITFGSLGSPNHSP